MPVPFQLTELLRLVVGGVLMGLANLVPGISGGTMLLATGVYHPFVEAVADVTVFRFRLKSLTVLATIGGAAAVAILLLAGPVKDLVIYHRWLMYSLFIGLTLGGVPVIHKLLGHLDRLSITSCVTGLAFMVLLSFLQQSGEASAAGTAPSSPNYLLLFIAGLLGASAMVLPGVSGSYLLLLLGQYVPILGAINRLRNALSSWDTQELFSSGLLLTPVALGIVLGLAGVSNFIKFMLQRHPRLTLGFLLGLILGAIIALWPFQQTVLPESATPPAGISRDLPVETFTPSPWQLLETIGLVALGFAVTYAIGRLDQDSGTRGQPLR